MNTYTLPCPSMDSYTFTEDAGKASGGSPFTIRRDYFQRTRVIGARLNYNTQQLSELHDFVRDNLNSWFLMSLPSGAGMALQTVRLLNDIAPSRTGPNVWDIPITLEVAATIATVDFPQTGMITYENALITYQQLDVLYGGPEPIPTLDISVLPTPLATSYACTGNAISCPTPLNQTSAAATVTVVGGTGTNTVAWTYISGDSYTINSPASLVTTFTTSLAHNTSKSGVYRCTVTSGLQVDTVDLTVTFAYTYTASGITLTADINPVLGVYTCTGTTDFCTTPQFLTSDAPVTVSVAGGVGAIVHSWTYVSGDVLTINSPSAGTTTFSASVPRGTSKSGVYRDSVTRGGDSNTIDVTATLTYTFTLATGGGGGGGGGGNPPNEEA